jgi:hypothetical protein
MSEWNECQLKHNIDCQHSYIKRPLPLSLSISLSFLLKTGSKLTQHSNNGRIKMLTTFIACSSDQKDLKMNRILPRIASRCKTISQRSETSFKGKEDEDDDFIPLTPLIIRSSDRQREEVSYGIKLN